MRTLILAALFLALSLVPAQAECFKPKEMHDRLISNGLFPQIYMVTDLGYMMTVFIGGGQYVVVLENPDIACVSATGKNVYQVKGFKI